MNSKEFILYLHSKGLNATQIHQTIKNELNDESISYSAITKYIRSQSFTTNPQPSIGIAKRPDLYKDQKIENSLRNNPDFSIREIAADTDLSPSTVYFILTTRMNYKSMILQKVPHQLTNENKIKRVECSRALLEHMESIKRSGYRYYSTGDESFFFWDTHKKRIWLPTDEKPPKVPNERFFATKTMITIFWSPCGIQVLKALEPGQSFNSTYFMDEILDELLNYKYAANSKMHKKKFYIHIDNARPHKSSSVMKFCEENNLCILPHPPYSPDLAPSDFFLFGYMKEKLEGAKFDSADELIEAIYSIFEEIPQEVLKSVFIELEERLKKCIEANGDYFQI